MAHRTKTTRETKSLELNLSNGPIRISLGDNVGLQIEKVEGKRYNVFLYLIDGSKNLPKYNSAVHIGLLPFPHIDNLHQEMIDKGLGDYAVKKGL